MSDDDRIKWVVIKLDLPPDLEALLQARMQTTGLSLECYCIQVLYKDLLKDATPAQKERWLRDLPATLRRNGCEDVPTHAEIIRQEVTGVLDTPHPSDRAAALDALAAYDQEIGL
jgi:hypothetical protein